jgi:periplasmic protein TonB
MRVVWLALLFCSFTTISSADPQAEYKASISKHLLKFPPFPTGKPSRDQGTTIVGFQLDDAGKITSSSVKETSGSEILDKEAIATVLRAQPYPTAPDGIGGANSSFTIPLHFS